MKNKILVLLLSILLISVFTAQLCFCKGRWVKVGDNWRYDLREGSGNYVTEKWRAISDDGINEKVYYFDIYGNMVTGPILIDNNLYVYADTGEAITTGYDIDGVHYNTDGKGKVLGLPMFFDLSRFPKANTSFFNPVGSQTVYDSDVMPTASAQVQ